MSRITNMTEQVLGAPTARLAGYRRTFTGLRTGDRREIVFGLTLLAFTYLRRTSPRRELIYRQKLPAGSHVTIRNTERGRARLEIREGSDTGPVQTR